MNYFLVTAHAPLRHCFAPARNDEMGGEQLHFLNVTTLSTIVMDKWLIHQIQFPSRLHLIQPPH